MKNGLFTSCVVCFFGANVAIAAPKDISRIETLAAYVEEGVEDPSSEFQARYIDSLAETLLVIAEERARHNGYAELIDWDDSSLILRARSRVDGLVRSGAAKDARNDRRDKFHEALITATAPSTGEDVVAGYLGLPAPGKLVKYKRYKGMPAIQKQMTITDPGTGGLRLEAEGFALAGERGGAGEGNGLFDAGEWVNINFAVVNVSPEPYFSTSAWLRSASECAYVAGTRENEMPELARFVEEEEEEEGAKKKASSKKSSKSSAKTPVVAVPDAGGLLSMIVGLIPFVGNDRGSKVSLPVALPVAVPKVAALPLAKDKRVAGQFTSWVYLSDTCSDQKTVSLKVYAKDTHRTTDTTPETLGIQLNVRNRGKGKVRNYMMDADRPGFSDASDATSLGAGNLVEFSHGLEVNASDLKEAYQGWGVSKFHKPVVESTSYRHGETMLGIGSGKLRPGDDYDLEMLGRGRFQEAADTIAVSRGWFRSADGRVILASDVAVLYDSPDPREEVVAEIKPEADCDNCVDDDEDGQIDCDDDDCAEAEVCQEPDKPVDVGRVLGLFEEFASIEATPIKPQPGNLIAVTHSYELALDQAEFRKRYQCFVEGLTLEECLAPDCPECEEEEEEEEEKIVYGGGVDAIAYNYRNYFVAPLDWAPQASPYPPMRVYGGIDLASTVILDDGSTRMTPRLRGSFDYGLPITRNRLRLTGTGGFSLPGYPWSASEDESLYDVLGVSSYMEAYAVAGLGYYFLRVADILSFEPRVQAGLDLRYVGNIYNDTDGDGEADVVDNTVGMSPYVEASFLAHLELGESLGLYGEVAYRVLANNVYAAGLDDFDTRVAYSLPLLFGVGLTYSLW